MKKTTQDGVRFYALHICLDKQIIIAIALSWLVCYILTLTDAVPDDPNHWAYKSRTDIRREALEKAAWFQVPYPCEFGAFTVEDC